MYYSQHGEDEFLNETYFKNKKNGRYIELGALDGVRCSNTKFYEDTLNWTGVLIEPHPLKYKDLVVNRPKNVLSNSLVSSLTEELDFRYFINYPAEVSGIEQTLPKNHYDIYFDHPHCHGYPQTSVKMTPKPLTEIIKAAPFDHYDLLSLDVEGHEYEVLQSWDFSVPIDVILIEMLGMNSERDELCRQHLLKHGYVYDNKIGINEVYVLSQKSEA
jgi:FkbM family methyltransferase